MKFVPLQAFVPNDEAILLPDQQLQFVAAGVNEREKCAREGVLDDILRQNGEAVDLLSHIYGCSMQVHPFSPAVRSQHPQAPP
jgi:hypothetical protein